VLPSAAITVIFRILKIPAFPIPGFKDSGFSRSGPFRILTPYPFRSGPFRILTPYPFRSVSVRSAF
jgi:hypothetical protein